MSRTPSAGQILAADPRHYFRPRRYPFRLPGVHDAQRRGGPPRVLRAQPRPPRRERPWPVSTPAGRKRRESAGARRSVGLAGVRRRGIALLLADCGCAAADALAEELTDLYFHHRHAPTAPFADAAAAIPLLAGSPSAGYHLERQYQPRLARWGLDGYFRAVVTPTAAGCSKPDPAIFHHAAAALGCRAGRTAARVAIDGRNDVAGAYRAGCQASPWYCRVAPATPADGVPHRVVSGSPGAGVVAAGSFAAMTGCRLCCLSSPRWNPPLLLWWTRPARERQKAKGKKSRQRLARLCRYFCVLPFDFCCALPPAAPRASHRQP